MKEYTFKLTNEQRKLLQDLLAQVLVNHPVLDKQQVINNGQNCMAFMMMIETAQEVNPVKTP